MDFSSIKALFQIRKLATKQLREYGASSVDRTLREEALTLLALLLQYLLNTYLDSIVFSV